MEIIWQSYGNHQIPRLNFNQQMQLQMHQALEQTRWPLRRVKPVGFWTKNNGFFLGVFLLGFLKSSWCFSLISYTKIREIRVLFFNICWISPWSHFSPCCEASTIAILCSWGHGVGGRACCVLRAALKNGWSHFHRQKATYPNLPYPNIEAWNRTRLGELMAIFGCPADWSLQNPRSVTSHGWLSRWHFYRA